MPIKNCPCGSGFPRFEIVDARGIFCTFACDACEGKKLAKFRPEIFTDPNYSADEPIDGDDEDLMGLHHGRNK